MDKPKTTANRETLKVMGVGVLIFVVSYLIGLLVGIKMDDTRPQKPLIVVKVSCNGHFLNAKYTYKYIDAKGNIFRMSEVRNAPSRYMIGDTIK